MLKSTTKNTVEVKAKTIFGRQSLIVSQPRTDLGEDTLITAEDQKDAQNIYTSFKPPHSVTSALPKLILNKEDTERVQRGLFEP